MTVQQPGEGNPRDPIVIAHGGLTPAIRAVAPQACVVGLSFPPLKGHYALKGSGAGMLPPLAELVKGALGGVALRHLILVGFSEGCQAVRAWLAAGEVPSAVLAIDGAHGSKPSPSAAQVQPWRSFFARARAAQRPAVITATSIPTGNYLSTSTMLPILTGFQPPPSTTSAGGSVVVGDVGIALAVLGSLANAAALEASARAGAGPTLPDGWEQGPGFLWTQQGLLYAEQWPGKDAAAHVQQAQQGIPRLLGRVLSELAQIPAAPWVRGLTPGDPPPAPPGVVFPAIPGGGGGGGRPPSPATPPAAPPAPPAPPPPPSSASSAAGPLVVLVLGLGFALMRR